MKNRLLDTRTSHPDEELAPPLGEAMNAVSFAVVEPMTTNLIDLTGRRFGWLRVLARAANGKGRQIRYLCLCGCGKETTKDGASLRAGNATSCGCRETLRRKAMAEQRLAARRFGGERRIGR